MTALGLDPSKFSFKSVLHSFSKSIKKSFLKFIAYFVLVTFTSTQIAWSAPALPSSGGSNLRYEKEVSSDDDVAEVSTSATLNSETLTDFLSDTLALTPARHPDPAKAGEESITLSFPNDVVGNLENDADRSLPVRQAGPTENFGDDRSEIDASRSTNNSSLNTHYSSQVSFDYALDLFEPEYAAAVVIEELTEEDIEELLALDFEVGIVVMEGEYVLFSTGNTDEIGTTPAAKKLLAKATFTSHTHVDVAAQKGPSNYDLKQAREREYVLTENGAYIYRENEKLNQGRPLAIKDYLTALKLAKDLSSSVIPTVVEGSLGFARDDAKDALSVRAHGRALLHSTLNEFITQMDLYNAADAEREMFRASEVSSFSDLFERENNTDIGDDWIETTNNFTIENGRLKHANSGFGLVLLDQNLTSDDVDVEVSLDFQNNTDNHGLVARYQDANNYYYALVSKTGVRQIIKKVAGVDTVLGTYNGSSSDVNNEYALRLVLDDDNLKLYVDGNLDVEVTDSTFTSGELGLWSDDNGTRVHDFKLYTLPSVAISSFTDDFENPNSSYLRRDWIEAQNDFELVSGELRHEGDGFGLVLLARDLGDEDYDLEAGLDFNSSAYTHGLVARYQDANNYYYASINEDGLREIIKKVGGVDTVLGSYSGSSSDVNNPYTLRFTVDGDNLKLYVGGVLDVEVTDSTFSAGDVGVWSDDEGTRVESFSVETLPIAAISFFSDDFERPNSSHLNKNWIETTDNFEINGGRLKHDDSGFGLALLDRNLDSESYDIEADLEFRSNTTEHGLVARYQDENNYYYAYVDESGLRQIIKKVGGIDTVLGSYSGVAGDVDDPYLLRFIADGDNLKLYVEGNLEVDVTDSTFTDGKIGIWSDNNGTQIEDFLVKTIASSNSTVVTLSDNTALYFDASGVLEKEVTPSGDEIHFLAGGRTEKFIYADGTSIHYTETVPTGGVYPAIQIKDSAGNLIEEIDKPSPSALDESTALKLTLEDGINAYYIDGDLVEFRTETGVRITDFTLDTNDDIVDAYIVYQDGAVDVIRKGSLLRRMGADGTILDVTPTEYAVREMDPNGSGGLNLRYFSFDKTSQTSVNESKIFTLDSNGAEENVIRYDDLGILIQAREGSVKDYVYARAAFSDTNYPSEAFKTTLDTSVSTTPTDQTLTEAYYRPTGEISRIVFHDTTMITYADDGSIDSILDSSGNSVDYSYLQDNGFAEGLTVTRGDNQFVYAQDGFLKEIHTESGTIMRTAEDTNGDGKLTDEQVVDILLEEVGGNRLLEFELDSNGNILNGIIETKEGIKQTIANGVLTGFETVDGRFYDYDATNKKAELAEWNFRDGTRVVFGGQAITEILFPNGNKLHTLGLSSEKEATSYIEELEDGTKKYYESPAEENLKQPRLTKIETPNNTTILYAIDGLATQVTLNTGETNEQVLSVKYGRDSAGEILEITFFDEHQNRTFTPEGNLIELLHKGVNAEIEGQSIQKLFTRFGEVTTPTFDANGLLSGEVEFTDGAKLTITGGALTKAVRANGTVVDYVSGRVDKVTTANGTYALTYVEDTNGKIEDIRITLEHETGTPEFSLVPFLQKPELLLEPNQGPDHPVTFIDDVQIVNDEYKMGGGSAYFDGIVDHLEVPNHDDWDFGREDFTIEAYVNFTPGTVSYRTIASKYLGGTGWIFFVDPSTGLMKLFSGGTVLSQTAGSINDGEWHHLAVVREGNTIKFFKDGVQVGSNLTAAATYNSSASVPLQIGTYANTYSYFKGHMDELRISKGVARYTSNFTPHTEPHTPDVETKLLLQLDPEPEQTSALVADVEELSAILAPRTVHNTLEDRFNVRSIYNLSEEETSSGLHSLTFNGNVAHNTADSKFGGSSASFDGSGDTITSPTVTDWDFGSEDFTIDAWVQFPAGSAGYRTIASKYSGAGWIFFVEPSGGAMKLFGGGSVLDVTAGAFTTDQWYHVAVVKTGNTIKFFRDGVQVGTDKAAAATYDGSNSVPLQIGVYQNSYSYFKGRMDELRISKGIARWTSNFVPPTTEYTRDNHTKLLLHFGQNEFDNASEVEDPAPEEDPEGVDTTLNFAKLSWDPTRGESYEFATDYLPEWVNVSLDNATHNQGYVTRAVRMQIDDNLPATTSDLIDMNGDGLVDRVYLDASTTADFWWVQLNNGQGFEEAIQWTGMDRYWDPTSSSWYHQNQGAITHYMGRIPGKMGDLIDLNGDGLPDRVLTMIYDNDSHWYVQWNNGSGFDAAVLWADNVQTLSVNQLGGVKNALSMRGDQYQENVQELVAELIDLDGDGLLDRVVRPFVGSFDHWFFQKNLGKDEGFADAVIWEGVDNSFHTDANVGGSLSWYNSDWASHDFTVDLSGLYDLNGDGLLDRVLTKLSDPNDANSRLDWYVQLNTGEGFDAAVLWDDNVRVISSAPNDRLASGLHGFKGKENPRRELMSLIDVTGDGLLDRVTLPSYAETAQSSWWVEINEYDAETETFGFKEAVEWVGIEGSDATETSIGQDDDRFRMNNNGGVAGPHGRTPDYVKQTVDLKDLNGDKILDRIIFNEGDTSWLVQFGTGEGFLPGTEMEIVGLIGDAEKVASSRYDHVHLSIKAAQDIPAALGSVEVSLTQAGHPEPVEGSEEDPVYQKWTITDLTSDWKDIYLPINRAKADASDLRIEFIPAEGEDPNIPIFVDNLTFMTLRPDQSKDWLDRILTEESVVAEVHDDQDQTLDDYLGLVVEGGVPGAIASLAWDSILNAQTRIEFNEVTDEAEEFETFYGTVTEVDANGEVTESTLPDGTVITFNAVDPNAPQNVTQTITDDQGNVTEELSLSYGRVRTVEQQETFDDGEGNNIQIEVYYDYEFVRVEGDASATPFGGSPSCSNAYVGVCPLPLGTEVTVVSSNDPANPNIERYRDTIIGGNEVSQLISRTQPNGVMTSFHYNEFGELVKSEISYKSRIRNTFYHGKTEEGHTTLETEEGVIEEYNSDGDILYHLTPEGFRYWHDNAVTPLVYSESKQTEVLYYGGFVSLNDLNQEPVTLPDGRIIDDIILDGGVVTQFDLDDGEGNTELYLASNGDFEQVFDSQSVFVGIRFHSELDAVGNFVQAANLSEETVDLADGRVMNNIVETNGIVASFDVTDSLGNLRHYDIADHTFIQEFETDPETGNPVFIGVRFDFEMVVETTVYDNDNPVVCTQDCETINRIVLTHFTSEAGELAEYAEDVEGALGETELKGLSLTDGTRISFTRVERKEELEIETGQSKVEINLLDAMVFHTDGTVTEYRNGMPYSITTATERVIDIAKDELGEFVNENESAVFHYGEALTLWDNLVNQKWKDFRLPGSVAVQTEFRVESDGPQKLVTRKYAEGAVELYDDNGNLEQILSSGGERLLLYTYDESGKPIDIDMEQSRRNLNSVELRLRADLAIEREHALRHVAEREQVLDETINGEYITTRNRLLAIRDQLEDQKASVLIIPIKGKKGRALIGDALQQIQVGLDQINTALAQLAEQREAALAQLAQQVQEANDDIELQSFNATVEITAEINASKRAILRQELTPIIYNWYREILGRDPSEAEYDNVISGVDYDNVPVGADLVDENGSVTDPAWLAVLKTDLNGSTELTERTNEVQAIKDQVDHLLNGYLTLNDADKLAFAQALGIDPSATTLSEAKSLVTIDVDQNGNIPVLEYIQDQSLHFGQSAYLALEAMLKDADVTEVAGAVALTEAPGTIAEAISAITDSEDSYSRLVVATRLILTDILTGTLTPIEEGDLILSLYALRKTAKSYGVSMGNYGITYEGLKKIFEDACVPADGSMTATEAIRPENCSFRLVAHIDGNHFIIVTGFETRVRTELKVQVDENGRSVLDANGDPVMIEVDVLDEDGNQILDEYVTYLDPGAGPEDAIDVVSITVSEFLRVWVDPRNPTEGFGFIFSPRGPPESVSLRGAAGDEAISDAQYYVLTEKEEMQVRGAFFGLFALAIAAAIVNAVAAVVSAVIAAVSAIISGIIAGISAIAGGIGGFFGGLVSGNILGALGSLFQGIVVGLGHIAGGLIAGAGHLIGGVFNAAQIFHSGLVGALKGVPVLGAAFNNSVLAGFLNAGLIGLEVQGLGTVLDKIGLSPKISQSIVSGGKIIIGVGLLATGNPLGLGLIAGGTGDLLSLHTSLSPTVTSVIGIGAAALGAFAGGFPSGGEVLTGLAGLKAAAPYLVKDLATAGVLAIGNEIGLSSALSSLIAIPVSAAIGGGASSLINGDGFSNILSSATDALFDSSTLGGLVSVGSSIGLDSIGAPTVLQSFVPGLLGGIASGFVGGGSGGGGPGVEEMGESLLGRISNGIAKFGKAVSNAVGNVVSFGSKVIDGIGTVTKEGFKKAIKTFSGLFDRQAQEKFIEIDELDAWDAKITIGSDGATLTDGDIQINWTQASDQIDYHRQGASIEALGIKQDESGNFFGNIAFAEELRDGITLNNRLDEFGNISTEIDGLNSAEVRQVANDFVGDLANYVGRVFSGSQVGAGVGASAKLVVGPVEIKAGIENLVVSRVTESGIEDVSQSFSGIQIKFGKLNFKFDFETGKISTNVEHGDLSTDGSSVSVGGTVFNPATGAAINIELNVNPGEITKFTEGD